MRLQELLQERAGLIDKQEQILNTAHNEKRNLTVDEDATFKNLDKAIGDIEEQVEREKKFDERIKNLDGVFNLIDLRQQTQDGFESFGEFLVAVAKAGMSYNRIPGAGTLDPRLLKRMEVQDAASGLSATVPSDGGFLISPTVSNEIIKRTYETGQLASKCTVFDIGQGSDSLEVPYIDETTRVTGSRWGGVRIYREGEVDTPTSTKAYKLGRWECRVTDLKALVYATERLLNDATAIESLVNESIASEFAFVLDNEILYGDGASQCTGIIGNSATVSVTGETGQAAGTIYFENILKMWSRSWGRSRNKSSWYINQDCEPQLYSMVMSINSGGVPVYMPANGISGSPYGTLFGKPVIPIEQCETVGTVGDIIFADFSEYALVRKGGLKSASSIHVKFVEDEMTFKFSMRVNGKPKWKSKLTPYKGNNTLSPFVTLATR